MKRPTTVMFWLLAAATISIDAVVIAWVADAPEQMKAVLLFEALAFGQLSAACVWSVFSKRHIAWRAVVSLAAVLTAAYATARLADVRFGEAVAFFGSCATIQILTIWTLKHSFLWPQPRAADATGWRFSVGHILALMTIVAVLLSLFRTSELWQLAESVAADLISNCLMASTLVLILARRGHVLWRTASALFAAGLLGVLDWGYDWLRADPLLAISTNDLLQYVATSLIQALVIILWVEIGQIVPRHEVRPIEIDAQPQ